MAEEELNHLLRCLAIEEGSDGSTPHANDDVTSEDKTEQTTVGCDDDADNKEKPTPAATGEQNSNHASSDIPQHCDASRDDAVESQLETTTKTTSPSNLVSPPPTIICDAWYGFPTQKRPRKERINAVGRQLSNFLEWRSELSFSISQRDCDMSLLGNGGDVDAVQKRMRELALAAGTSDSSLDSKRNNMNFQCNTIHEFIDQQKINNSQNTTNTNNEEVVYLSPDASQTLSSTSPPPRTVIIGMLIDRRITTDRSRKRAEETLSIRAVKLPLDELNVQELTSQEPLNVDTVMELMQRWWWNCDGMEQRHAGDSCDDEALGGRYRKCFLGAAAWAMKSQRDRHPNRTVHMANSK